MLNNVTTCAAKFILYVQFFPLKDTQNCSKNFMFPNLDCLPTTIKNTGIASALVSSQTSVYPILLF